MAKVCVEQFDVAIPSLPEAFHGFRILHVSDVHASLLFPRRGRDALEAIASQSCDIVICTGDTVNREKWWPRAVAWLLELPRDVPRLAVPGNWDYRRGGGAGRFEAEMEKAGFLPLLNRPFAYRVNGEVLQVAGFDDIRYGALDPGRAMAGLDPGRFILGVTHNPDLLLHLDGDEIDLLLTGHTHGGQILLPRVGVLATSTDVGNLYASGLIPLRDHRYLYVSRGLGEGTLPLRIGCPPELTVLTLRRAA